MIPCPSHDPVPKWMGPDPRSSGRRGSGPDGVAGLRVLAPKEPCFLRDPELASLSLDLRPLLHLEHGMALSSLLLTGMGEDVEIGRAHV